MLTVEASSGAVLHKVKLVGGPSREIGAETFLAGPDANGLLYSCEPLEQTHYSVLSYNTSSGEVNVVATPSKEQLAGIGVCIGFVDKKGNALYYTYKDGLVQMDLTTHNITPVASKIFIAPIRPDPTRPGTALGIISRDDSDNPGTVVTALSRLDLQSGNTTDLYVFNSSYYHHLCHCTLPLRAQDQADISISSDGKTVYVALSFNDKPVQHESLVTTGIFVMEIGADGNSASLVSEVVGWKQGNRSTPRIVAMGMGVMSRRPAEP